MVGSLAGWLTGRSAGLLVDGDNDHDDDGNDAGDDTSSTGPSLGVKTEQTVHC